MRYVPEPGLIFDTVTYTVMYFNKNAYIKNQKLYGSSDIDIFEYYDSFRLGKRKIDPPDSLFPFFYYNTKTGSFYNFSLMLSYFLHNFDFLSADADTFFESLSGEGFKSFCYHFYFDALGDKVDIDRLMQGEKTDCMCAFASFSNLGDDMAHFLDFILNFEELAKELKVYMIECYKRMLSFHGQQNPNWVEDLSLAFSDNKELITEALKSGIEVAEGDEQPFTVHLMDPLILFGKQVPGMHPELYFIGAYSIKHIVSWADYSQITIQSFGAAFGNDVKREIIFQLMDGEKTVSQLSKCMYTSRSTIDRCVAALYDSLVIRIRKKIGSETYYSLNSRYFLAAKEEVSRTLDQIIRHIEENDRISVVSGDAAAGTQQ